MFTAAFCWLSLIFFLLQPLDFYFFGYIFFILFFFHLLLFLFFLNIHFSLFFFLVVVWRHVFTSHNKEDDEGNLTDFETFFYCFTTRTAHLDFTFFFRTLSCLSLSPSSPSAASCSAAGCSAVFLERLHANKPSATMEKFLGVEHASYRVLCSPSRSSYYYTFLFYTSTCFLLYFRYFFLVVVVCLLSSMIEPQVYHRFYVFSFSFTLPVVDGGKTNKKIVLMMIKRATFRWVTAYEMMNPLRLLAPNSPKMRLKSTGDCCLEPGI